MVDRKDLHHVGPSTVDDSVRRPNELTDVGSTTFWNHPAAVGKMWEDADSRVELADELLCVGRGILSDEIPDTLEVFSGMFGPPQADQRPSRAATSS